MYYDAASMLYDLRRIYYALPFGFPSSNPLLCQRSIMLCNLYITYSMTLHIVRHSYYALRSTTHLLCFTIWFSFL